MTSASGLLDGVESLTPFVGRQREMHRWVASRATAEGLVTINTIELAKVVGVTVKSVQRWVWQSAMLEGYLTLVVDRRKLHRPSTFRVTDPCTLIEG